MTDHTNQYTTVTVPVGLGGKSNPYIPDPAPTLLVELASVDRAKAEAKVAGLLREAEATAASVSAEAEAAAATLCAEAEETAASVTAKARADADAIIAAAEDDAQAVRRAADESVADIRAELETRQVELEERAAALDALQSELEERDGHLTERLAAVDAEVAEAATVLSSAHSDADSVLAEARVAAEEILESARQQGEDDARALIAEARSAAENDAAVEERIAELESVHRIEVQVLHDREVELLEWIAVLEARATASPPAAATDHDTPSLNSLATPEDAPADAHSKRNGRAARLDEDDAVAIDLDGEHADVTVRKDSQLNGRHSSEDRATDWSSGASPIATHAPLTEQLSTSAFRAMPENERRGRRRR
jgi:hypothetical protein